MSMLGVPFCCFPCFGKAKLKNPQQGSSVFDDLCGANEQNCPLSIFSGSSTRYVYLTVLEPISKYWFSLLADTHAY